MNEINKVLVTGADGMLGSVVCRELLKQQYRVCVFVLNKEKANALNGLELEFFEGDVLNKHDLEKCMAGVDYVIHIAALTSFWPRKSKKVREINLLGTKNVLELAAQFKLKRMVHIGTASSFASGDLDHPGNENNSFTAGKYGSDYIDSKYQAQQMLLAEHKSNNLPVIILNPTFMIGPFDSGPSSGIMLQAFYKDQIPGCSSGGKNFIYSGDVAVAAVNALTSGRVGECYIVGNENLSYEAFLAKAAKVMNKNKKLLHFPSFLILLAGAWSSLVAILFGKKPVLSFTMARFSLLNQFYDSTKAVNELGLPQTPIETAIEECMDWFSKNGYLK